MTQAIRVLLAGTAFLGVSALILIPGAPVSAEPSNAGQAAPATQTIELTQQQIDGLVSAQAELAKLQTGNGQKPNPKVEEQVEAIAKKAGFAGSDELGSASDAVEAVLDGMDPDTKTYVGTSALIKKQIAEVEADKSLSKKDKTVALKDLKEALAAGDAPKPSPGNIALVSKNFDKLSQLQGEP